MQWLDRLLDKSIYFSFDQSGYERHAKTFNLAIFNGKGKVCLLKVSSKGIGQAADQALTKNGVTVYNLSRTPTNEFEHTALDLSNLDEIKSFASNPELPQTDLLVHNAGLTPNTLEKTSRGNEMTWATHTLGHYALTKALIKAGKLAPNARIIFVTSGRMYLQPLNLNNLTREKRPYDKYVA